MELASLTRGSDCEWRIAPESGMRVAGVIYADKRLVHDMDEKVRQQICNVARLPGIVGASFAMPEAHWGYGFLIRGVAAFDPDEGGVISAGGVGFDISCGVRTLHTGLGREALTGVEAWLANELFAAIPAGIGRTGAVHLSEARMHDMLTGEAQWAVAQGYGAESSLEYVEERGMMLYANPGAVSQLARRRQRDEMGTLGSGNHYLEVQQVVEVFRPDIARAFGLQDGQVVVSIHCGSRGLGHQIGTESLREMVMAAGSFGIKLPDRELACAPIRSELGERYLGAMRAAINCALANRQILTHLTRQAFSEVLPQARLSLLYDVLHNTGKADEHDVDGRMRLLYVQRKGATRAFGPGHPNLPTPYQHLGQPVLIGGSMGTESYVLAGVSRRWGPEPAFSSACHRAGRQMSRTEARRNWQGGAIVRALADRGILVRSPSMRGVADEAPDAYKPGADVVGAAQSAGLACKVARLLPLICIKG